MTLKQLLYFTTIVECQNISQAAKKLHIAQPPLSAQMKALESEYGISLFERGSRNIKLTTTGIYLYDRAKHILEEMEEIDLELSNISNKQKCILRFGAISPSGINLLGKYIGQFILLYPNITFEIKEEHTAPLIEMILKNSIELAIVRTPFLTDNLVCYYLDYEPMYAVASMKFFSKNISDTITLDELVQYPLIYHRRFENLLAKAFQAINLPFSPYCTNDDGRTSLSLAQSEVGCAIVTESTLPSTLPSGIIARKIDNEILNTRLALIHKQNIKLSKSAQLFINYFLKDNTNIQTT